MDTCGPSNAQQQLKNYVQRDASLHRETVGPFQQRLAQQSFRTAQPDTSVSQFAKFNSSPHSAHFVHEMDRFSAHMQMAAGSVGYDTLAHNDPQRINRRYVSQPSNLAHHREDNWTDEFARFRISDNRPVCSLHCTENHQHHRFQAQPQGTNSLPTWRPQFGRYKGTNISFAGNTAMEIPQMDDSEAFAAAFAAAEESLQRLHAESGTVPANKVASDTTANGSIAAESVSAENTSSETTHGANIIAEQILDTVNSNIGPDLTEKMRNSQFMNLMNKLKTNEVELDAKETQFETNGDKVDAYDLDLDSSHDWPPQRSSLNSELEQPPQVRAEPPRYSNYFQTKLDDPETYHKKLRENLDPRLFKRSQYSSSFFEAANLNQLPLKTSDWEEKYDEWFS